MSVHAFGANVEEVQRKLSEILPLIDTGVDRVQQLHESLQTELSSYQSNYENLEGSINSVADAASALGDDIANVQSEVETGVSALSDELVDLGSQGDRTLQQLQAARERVETGLDGAGSELQAESSLVESHFDTMAENADSLQAQITSLQQQSEGAFTNIDESVNEFATNWQTDEGKSQEAIGTLKSALSEAHTPAVKQKFDGFHANTLTTTSNIVNLLTEKDGGMSDFFSAFDTDVETLSEDFKAQMGKSFGELKECAESECGKVVHESLENLAKEVVEAFAAEIIASVATTQLGVATTGTLSPIIPQLAIAKKVTGVINSIL